MIINYLISNHCFNKTLSQKTHFFFGQFVSEAIFFSAIPSVEKTFSAYLLMLLLLFSHCGAIPK